MTSRKAKVLMPVVATLTNVLAKYVAQKGSQYLEQRNAPEAPKTTPAAVSGDELEQRRRERAEHRAARRKAS